MAGKQPEVSFKSDPVIVDVTAFKVIDVSSFRTGSRLTLLSPSSRTVSKTVSYESVQYNFSPIDKWLEAIEENKKLYERLLPAEREKNDQLQKLLESKQ